MTYFSEKQTAGPVFHIASLVICLVMLVVLWRYLEKRIYILFSIPFLLLAVYYNVQRLEVRIDDDGIHYHMFPTQLSDRTLVWSQIHGTSVMDHITYSTSRYANFYETYQVYDTYGLYIYRNNDPILILGTRRPEELQRVLYLLAQKGKL